MTLTASSSGGTAPYTYTWSNSATGSSISVCPTVGTNYTVSAVDANGCPSDGASAPFHVNVVDVHCGNNGSKVEVCHNTGSTSNPTTVLCISPSAVPTHLASHGDCLGNCNETQLRRLTPSANRINLEDGNIAVYPNPATGRISIALKEMGSAYQSYQITDINGRVIATHAITGDVHSDVISLDISSYAKGIYIIRTVTEDGASLTKFTVK
jgi:hypothetical protein